MSAHQDRLEDLYAEIDRLRVWKNSAMQVLGEWETVWVAAGQPGPLGSSKALSVRARLTALNDGVLTVTAELHAEIARLRNEIDTLRLQVEELTRPPTRIPDVVIHPITGGDVP